MDLRAIVSALLWLSRADPTDERSPVVPRLDIEQCIEAETISAIRDVSLAGGITPGGRLSLASPRRSETCCRAK